MRRSPTVWLLLAAGVLLACGTVATIGWERSRALFSRVMAAVPRRARAEIALLRFPGPVAVADSFVAAAALEDTARLEELVADSAIPAHIIALLEATRGFRALAERGFPLAMANTVTGHSWVVVSFRLPYRFNQGACYAPGENDQLQLTLVPAGHSWHVLYFGTDPC